mgnify:CR=1 FL=1
MDGPVIVLVGNPSPAERTWLMAPVAFAARLEMVDGVADAARLTARLYPPPYLVVLWQDRPDRYNAAEIDRLTSLLPTAQLVAVTGGWCEGETRSGRPLDGVTRVAWNRWPAWCAKRFECEQTSRLPARSLSIDGRLIAVLSESQATLEWLCEACAQAGHAAVGIKHPARLPQMQPVAAIWDARNLDDLTALLRLRRAYPEAQVLVCAGFVRRQDMPRLRDAGVHRVLAKPLRLDDLSWQFGEIVNAARDVRSEARGRLQLAG